MYRLLIVDDEPVIVRGLYELFNELAESLEIEVYQAYSGQQAMRLMEKHPIDILLTDIEMPQVSGIELLKYAGAEHPNCKAIMLSGYNDFAYAQEAQRQGSIDYVLKTEGDEAIVKAVEKAAHALNMHWEAERLLKQAQSRLQSALPTMQRECLHDLLIGASRIQELPSGKFKELNIPLDSAQPLIAAVCKVDAWREDLSDGISRRDQQLLAYAVRNIAEELIGERLKAVHVREAPDQWMWLLQETDSGYVREVLGRTQHHADRLLGMSCSFIVSRQEVPWSELPETVALMKQELRFGIGLGREMALCYWDEPGNRAGSAHEPEKFSYTIPLKRLETFLESGQSEAFHQEFDRFLQHASEWSMKQPCMAGEIFVALSCLFAANMNRAGWMERIRLQIDIEKCFNYNEFRSWKEIRHYFNELADLIFKLHSERSGPSGRDVVSAVQAHIAAHLNGDLSLTTMGALVYLNPFYLSRLFKKQLGITLTDYVIHARMEKAKELLLSTHRKINDIALEVGFESASYFTRFFKRTTGMTPLDYRDNHK